MASQQGAEIRINRRTLWIAGEVYQLANLARVQTGIWRPGPAMDRYGGIPGLLKRILGVIVVIIFLAIVTEASGYDTGMRLFSIVFLIAAVLVLWYLVQMIRLALRGKQYALLLETTGSPFAVLTSTNRNEIDQVLVWIAEAMENPPTTPIVHRINNVTVVGDQINQSGPGVNIGKA